jgi:hypothetical protein
MIPVVFKRENKGKILELLRNPKIQYLLSNPEVIKKGEVEILVPKRDDFPTYIHANMDTGMRLILTYLVIRNQENPIIPLLSNSSPAEEKANIIPIVNLGDYALAIRVLIDKQNAPVFSNTIKGTEYVLIHENKMQKVNQHIAKEIVTVLLQENEKYLNVFKKGVNLEEAWIQFYKEMFKDLFKKDINVVPMRKYMGKKLEEAINRNNIVEDIIYLYLERFHSFSHLIVNKQGVRVHIYDKDKLVEELIKGEIAIRGEVLIFLASIISYTLNLEQYGSCWDYPKKIIHRLEILKSKIDRRDKIDFINNLIKYLKTLPFSIYSSPDISNQPSICVLDELRSLFDIVERQLPNEKIKVPKILKEVNLQPIIEKLQN